MKPLIVTGCGRSGTGYTAALLTAAGVECGHERVFTGDLRDTPEIGEGAADSSWFAVPYLPYQDDPHIAHQVRHPLAVVASWLANRSLESRFVRVFLRQWCPQALAENTPERGVLRYWIDWNREAAKHAHQRWAVEQIEPGYLAHALQGAGRSVDPDRIAAALKGTSRHTNTKKPTTPIGWGDIGGPIVDEAQDLVRQMGYWL